MDDRLETSNKLIRSFIRQTKTQTAAAKAMGVPLTTFRDWLYEINEVPLEKILLMKVLLKRIKEGVPTASTVSLQNHIVRRALSNNFSEENFSTKETLAITTRVHSAVQFEKELNKKSGRPKNNETVRNCDTINKRSAEIAAKKFGFKSKDTYLRAKKVILKGNSSLIKAMDAEEISIYHASILAGFSNSLQLELLSKNSKERSVSLKKLEAEKKQPVNNLKLSKIALVPMKHLKI